MEGVERPRPHEWNFRVLTFNPKPDPAGCATLGLDITPQTDTVRPMRRLLPTLALASLALLVPASAHAVIYGVEANNDLANSNRSTAQRTQTLDRMQAQGIRIVRVNMGWNELAENCGGVSASALANQEHPCYTWGVFDQVVSLASERGIQVLASISRAPRWLHGTSNAAYVGTTSSQWARTVLHYEAVMQATASRYRTGSDIGRVARWTVWNEPNSPTYFAPQHTYALKRAVPRRYAQMVARTAVAVRKVDPYAQVAAGPTGPTGGSAGIRPITFVQQVQAALPYFLPGTGSYERRFMHAWAHNPYPGVSTAPSRGTISSPSVGMANIRDLFRQLDRAPVTRGLPVWATEFGYQTNPPDRILGISAQLQGRFMAESYDWLDSTRRVPVQIWYGFRDPDQPSDWQSGTWYNNGRAKVSRLWQMRPVSVPADTARRGQSVRVWARSMVNPRATRIAMSTDGRTWRLLPIIGRRADGTMVQLVRVSRTSWFAAWDGVRGPARVVRVR